MVDKLQKDLMMHYEETLNFIECKKLKKYNLSTVRNFIIHIDKLGDSQKQKVYDILYEYLNLIRQTGCPTSNAETIELFNSYLSQIVIYYSRIGFITYISLTTYIFFIVLSIPIFLILKCSLIWYVIFGVLIIGHEFRIYLKKRQNKILGPGY